MTRAFDRVGAEDHRENILSEFESQGRFLINGDRRKTEAEMRNWAVFPFFWNNIINVHR